MDEETLFELVIGATQSQRAALLDQHCADDPQLRSRVERLIDAHLAEVSAAIDPTEIQEVLADELLDQTPDANRKARSVQQHPAHETGTVLGGKYTLKDLIAEGGMGEVWLATQAAPIKRRVAAKLIKAGLDSKQVIARFEAERQALAMMDHPNIAKVFDGGITEQGRPYFVMEYVKGIPLTDYCDQARLSVKQRLELFMPICQAIQHAHQKGIVHRDLKPSNILVCLCDGKPVCKVIDFGLAKAMHQPLTDHSLYTSHGAMVGTPLYMSPEQAEYDNLDVDTRTDIYSLGVVLYELLTGTTPLEREQLRVAAYKEVLRLIKEVEPPRPSTRLSQSDSLPSIAAQRSIEPKRLGRSLSGDLDWIVMKSLEKERHRRYDSAAGLVRDVERFLNEEAIEARPPSSTYRLSKFLRKHKLQATAFIVVVVAILAGSSVATWGWYKASEAASVSKNAEKTVRESLERVTAERDAKNAALAVAAEQRNVAEGMLIEGILRPIGYGSGAEKQAISDWAQLPDDRLKLQVLKVAFESPTTAIRVVKSREAVLQACVGLSPTRRAKALRLLASARSKNRHDNEIQLAATVMTLQLSELGTEVFQTTMQLLTNLETSNELLQALADTMVLRKHLFADEMANTIFANSLERLVQNGTFGGSFTLLDGFDLGAAKDIPRLRMLERVAAKPKDLFGLVHFIVNGKSDWQSLSGSDRDRWWNALITCQEYGYIDFSYGMEFGYGDSSAARRGLAALAPTATEEQLGHAWDLIALQMDENSWSVEEIKPFAMRATKQQIADSLESLLDPSKRFIREGWDNYSYLIDVLPYVELLFSRLDTAEQRRFLELAFSLPASEEEMVARKLVLYSALAPYLSEQARQKVLDELLTLAELTRAKDYLYPQWLSTLETYMPTSNENQVQAAWDLVTNNQAMNILEVWSSDSVQEKWGLPLCTQIDSVRSVGMRMTEEQITGVLEQLEENLSKEGRSLSDRQLAILSLIATLDHLREDQLSRLWEAHFESLLNDIFETGWQIEWGYGWLGLDLVIDRLAQDQLEDIFQYCRGRLTEPEYADQQQFTLAAISSYVSRDLSPNQIDELAELILPLVDDSTISSGGRAIYFEFLLLEFDRLSEARIQKLLNRDAPPRLDAEEISLHVALASRALAKQLEDRTHRMLDTIVAEGDYSYLGRLPQLVNDAESIARWLMAPSCIGKLRESLMMRFEELVLHDGKPVFLPDGGTGLDAGEAVERVGDRNGLTRQFLTVYDAAKWIDTRWPDFDLERQIESID